MKRIGTAQRMGKWGLLLGLLVVHFLAREQTAKTMPGKNPNFFHDDHGYFLLSGLTFFVGRAWFSPLVLARPGGDPPTDTQIQDQD